MIIEDFPGVGKTMLAKSLARSLDVPFSRIQFTPDLLPSDVTGVNVFNQRSNEFEFRPGPVFANVLLVDEINRASPKTQAALLEAMQENQVTIDGESYPLHRPFIVLATQNPIEYEGTYPLPEAQLDRFSMRLSLGYPPLGRRGADAERADDRAAARVADAGRGPRRRSSPRSTRRARSSSRRASTATSSRCSGTRARARGWRSERARAPGSRSCGSRRRARSPRAATSSCPTTSRRSPRPVLSHRLILAPEARSAGLTAEEIVGEAVEQTPVPV